MGMLAEGLWLHGDTVPCGSVDGGSMHLACGYGARARADGGAIGLKVTAGCHHPFVEPAQRGYHGSQGNAYPAGIAPPRPRLGCTAAHGRNASGPA